MCCKSRPFFIYLLGQVMKPLCSALTCFSSITFDPAWIITGHFFSHAIKNL